MVTALPIASKLCSGAHPHSDQCWKQAYRSAAAIRLGKKDDENQVQCGSPAAKKFHRGEQLAQALNSIVRQAAQRARRDVVSTETRADGEGAGSFTDSGRKQGMVAQHASNRNIAGIDLRFIPKSCPSIRLSFNSRLVTERGDRTGAGLPHPQQLASLYVES